MRTVSRRRNDAVPVSVGAGGAPQGLRPSWIKNDFDDDCWVIKGEGQRTLDFAKIPAPFRLTAKYLLWAVEFEADMRYNRRRYTKTSSFKLLFFEAKRFFAYLEQNEVSCLAFVNEQCLHNYCLMRAGIAKVQLGVRLGTLFEKLFRLGPSGSGTLPDGLCFAMGYRDIDRLIGPAAERVETRILLEETARSITNAAQSYINYTECICRLYEISRRIKDDGIRFHRANSHAAARARHNYLVEMGLLAEVETLCGKLEPLRYLLLAETASGLKRRITGGEHDDLAFLQFERVGYLMQHLVAACFIIVAAVCGYRPAEIFSIEPSSILKRGARVFVKTKVTKNTERADGIIVERPAHSAIFDIKHALERMAVAHGKEGYWRLNYGGVLSHDTLSKVIRAFAHEVAKVNEGKLKAREFRRYFAIFAIRRFGGPDDLVRRALLHIDTEAIRHYANDREAAAFLVEAKNAVAHEIADDLGRKSGKYVAIGASPLVRSRSTYRGTNLPVEQMGKVIERHEREKNLEIYPVAWGYCSVQPGDALGAKCGASTGMPVSVEMHPGNCGRCRHLIIGEDQLLWWELQRQTHLEVVQNPHSTRLLRDKSGSFVAMADAILAKARAPRGEGGERQQIAVG